MAEDDLHAGNVIAVPENGRMYAYEDEPISPVLLLRAQPPRYHGGKRSDCPESKLYDEYELMIQRHTGNSLQVTLRKVPTSDVFVRQRNERGYGTNAEVYTTTLSFAEICNRLLGPGCLCFEDNEALPCQVQDAMRNAYSMEESK